MQAVSHSPLVRIAVFYDGNYFSKVSDYYKYQHERKKRINLYGLHSFIRKQTAEKEKVDEKYCQIIEAHYFRGRFSAGAAKQAGKIESDRYFDDVLIGAGIIQHYYPLDETGSKPKERGIDVWLSLEAYDLAIHKRFDILALIACDGDYVPLVRKLNGISTRVMLLAWDFKYTWEGENYETRTSQSLIDESSYPIMMNQLIDSRDHKNDAVINSLFL